MTQPGDLDLDDLPGLVLQLVEQIVEDEGYAIDSDDLPGLVLQLMRRIAADREAA